MLNVASTLVVVAVAVAIYTYLQYTIGDIDPEVIQFLATYSRRAGGRYQAHRSPAARYTRMYLPVYRRDDGRAYIVYGRAIINYLPIQIRINNRRYIAPY